MSAVVLTFSISNASAMGTVCAAKDFQIEIVEDVIVSGAPVQKIMLFSADGAPLTTFQTAEISGLMRGTNSVSLIAGEDGKTGAPLLKLMSDADVFGSNHAQGGELRWYGKAVVNYLDRSGKPIAALPVAVTCDYEI